MPSLDESSRELPVGIDSLKALSVAPSAPEAGESERAAQAGKVKRALGRRVDPLRSKRSDCLADSVLLVLEPLLAFLPGAKGVTRGKVLHEVREVRVQSRNRDIERTGNVGNRSSTCLIQSKAKHGFDVVPERGTVADVPVAGIQGKAWPRTVTVAPDLPGNGEGRTVWVHAHGCGISTQSHGHCEEVVEAGARALRRPPVEGRVGDTEAFGKLGRAAVRKNPELRR